MTFENSMEPYAQLVRSLLPRAASVSLFDSTGKLLWGSAASTNPDLFALVGSKTHALRLRTRRLAVILNGL